MVDLDTLKSLNSLSSLNSLTDTKKSTPFGVDFFIYSVVDYANNSTSDASEALIYAAASVIFFAAYFTNIFVGFK